MLILNGKLGSYLAINISLLLSIPITLNCAVVVIELSEFGSVDWNDAYTENWFSISDKPW